jgi:hypothetical protein
MNTISTAAGGTPTGASTITLLDTYVLLQKQTLDVAGVRRIRFTVKNSHAGTLKAFKSNDGITYDQVDGDFAVGVAPATDINKQEFAVDGYPYFRLTWTNVTTQTTWRTTIILVDDRALDE